VQKDVRALRLEIGLDLGGDPAALRLVYRRERQSPQQRLSIG
jgi:hypothetical protein